MPNNLKYTISGDINLHKLYYGISAIKDLKSTKENRSFNVNIGSRTFKITKFLKNNQDNKFDHYIKLIKPDEESNIEFINIRYTANHDEIIYNGIITEEDLIKFDVKSIKSFKIRVASASDWIESKDICMNIESVTDYFIFNLKGKLPDIKIKINSEEEQHEFMCHSEYLVQNSQFFKLMLENDFREATTKIITIEVRYDIMIDIIKYLYTLKIDPRLLLKKNFAYLIDFYLKINEYQLNDLKEILKIVICNNLDTDNIIILLNSELMNQNDDFDGLLPKVIKRIMNKF